MKRLKPRGYQSEAVAWALSRRGAVVCMPTGTGKTLVAALWIRELLRRGEARRILVLEPTRFLVEQNAGFLRSQGVDAAPLHGSLPRPARERAWRSRVVVATPEIVVAEWARFSAQGFDAVVVDECHHTTGQDAYRRVMEGHRFRRRLGLSAYIPPSRRGEIEELIGEIRSWGWEDPRLRRYIPAWEAEIYEAPLNPSETRLYEELEKAWESVAGHERALLGNAIRWLVRDGALALRESLESGERLKQVLPEAASRLLYSPGVRPAHKLDALLRVLRDHEGFAKALVFVERVAVAAYLHKALEGWGTALIVGRRRIDPAAALEKARMRDTRVIVSTSAGEEGIDLPEADLMVVWSNTASPLRFIQRLGRVLRASEGARLRHRWVVFITTPDTVDVDSLVDGLLEARRAGVHVNIDPGVVDYVWSLSRRRRVLEALENPMPLDVLARGLEMPLDRAREAVEWLLDRGFAVYIYTGIGRIYASKTAIPALYERFAEDLNPSHDLEAKITVYQDGRKAGSLRGRIATASRKLQALLTRTGYLSRLHFSAQIEVSRGLFRLVNLNYTYKIDDAETLKLVLDNAYSCASYSRYLPLQ